jgi:hypothetical protein
MLYSRISISNITLLCNLNYRIRLKEIIDPKPTHLYIPFAPKQYQSYTLAYATVRVKDHKTEIVQMYLLHARDESQQETGEESRAPASYCRANLLTTHNDT